MTRPGRHSRHLSVLEVATKIGRVAAGSWGSRCCENSPRVAPEKQHGSASDNTSSLPNIVVSEFYLWQTITPEANVREAPNLERKVRRICHKVTRPRILLPPRGILLRAHCPPLKLIAPPPYAWTLPTTLDEGRTSRRRSYQQSLETSVAVMERY